eukprot:SAG31_NODE_399_length_16247_cov_19.137540_1_plen_167_part_00
MADRYRSVRTHEVDVLFAIQIPYARALSALEELRIAVRHGCGAQMRQRAKNLIRAFFHGCVLCQRLRQDCVVGRGTARCTCQMLGHRAQHARGPGFPRVACAASSSGGSASEHTQCERSDTLRRTVVDPRSTIYFEVDNFQSTKYYYSIYRLSLAMLQPVLVLNLG